MSSVIMHVVLHSCLPTYVYILTCKHSNIIYKWQYKTGTAVAMIIANVMTLFR